MYNCIYYVFPKRHAIDKSHHLFFRRFVKFFCIISKKNLSDLAFKSSIIPTEQKCCLRMLTAAVVQTYVS